MGKFVKPEVTTPNRKANARLQARLKDYETIKNKAGYHRPGSNKK